MTKLVSMLFLLLPCVQWWILITNLIYQQMATMECISTMMNALPGSYLAFILVSMPCDTGPLLWKTDALSIFPQPLSKLSFHLNFLEFSRVQFSLKGFWKNPQYNIFVNNDSINVWILEIHILHLSVRSYSAKPLQGCGL